MTWSWLWWVLVGAPVIYVVLASLNVVVRYVRHVSYIIRLPGILPANPLIGHIEEYPGPNEEGLLMMRERLREHHRLSFFFLGPNPSIAIVHPDTAKAIFKTSGTGYLAEPKPRFLGGAYQFLLPWLGDGLLIAEGKRWARNRRLLTPAFHFDILKPYININNKAVDILLSKLDGFAERDEYFEVFSLISLCTFDIILRCAFSYDNDCQLQGESHPYVKAVNELSTQVTYRLLRPWLYPDWVYALSPSGRKFYKNCDYVHSMATEVINKRRETLKLEISPEKKGRYLDFLDILLTAKDSDGKGLTDLEIRMEVDTFMFEGHDTTSSGISWTLLSLAQHPEHQRQCQEEIDDVLKGRDSDHITWDDLSQLKYLTQCIKESLRLHTPVPFIQRITTKDMYIDGHFVPKNTNISLMLYLMLHNPAVWTEPMEYRPERFASEGVDKMDSHQFVPFSAGPRNCIGQHFAMHELKVVVARILRRFHLEVKPGHPVRHEMHAVMRAEYGLYVKAVPRNV